MSDSGTVFLVVWLLATPVLMILWAVWHRRLKRQRVLTAEMEQKAAELGLEMQITLLAQALEYKESLAIEKLPEAEQEAILAGAIRKELEDARRLLLEAEEGEEEAA